MIENVPENQTAKVQRPVALGALTADDGRPDWGALTAAWSVAAGDPTHVLLNDASDPGTSVTFTQSGEYALILTVSDGERSSAARVAFTVTPTGTLLTIQ